MLNLQSIDEVTYKIIYKKKKIFLENIQHDYAYIVYYCIN